MSAAMSSASSGPSSSLDRAVAVDQALAGLGQRCRSRGRPMGDHDAHALVAGRAGEVVQETQAGVVGVVDVVDHEQQAVRRPRRGAPARRRRRTVAGASSRRSRRSRRRRAPGRSPRGGVGETVEQRRVAAAQVGQRLDDRRVRPRALDGADVPWPTRKPRSRARRGARDEQRRLADAGRPADDRVRRAPPPTSSRARSMAASSRSRPTSSSSGGDGATSCSASSRSRSATASRPGATPSSRRSARSRRSNWRSAAWRSPLAGVAAHQLEVGALVAGVELDHLLPAAVEAQKIEVAQAELLAAVLGPLARSGPAGAVHRRRAVKAGGLRGVAVGERGAGQLLELDDVDGRRRPRDRARPRRPAARRRRGGRWPDGRSGRPCAASARPRRAVSSGHTASMTCSRCRRRPGARARSLTSAAAWRRVQLVGHGTASTATSKRPSSVMSIVGIALVLLSSRRAWREWARPRRRGERRSRGCRSGAAGCVGARSCGVTA